MSSTPSLIQSTTSSQTFSGATHCDSFRSDSVSESRDSIPMLELLTHLSNIDDDIAFYSNGYQKVSKLCDTLQGDLYKALPIDDSNDDTNRYVAIKATDKDLFKKRIAVEGNMTFCVAENCVKEADILKRITLHNTLIGNHIVQFIDFFESDHNYYLVMEYVSSETNLRQFISEAKQYIQNGQLSIEQYQKTVKQLIWELCVTVQWLHVSMKCCHLNLRLENILVENATFIQTKDGMMIDPNISIKLCDFSVADVFENSDFGLCDRLDYLNNDAYSAPQVFNDGAYDGRCADNWRLGMILFECLTVGQRIYEPLDVNIFASGHWALTHGKLKQYLQQNNLFSSYFNPCSFALLNDLLNVNEAERLKGIDILKHEWFEMYYKRDMLNIEQQFSERDSYLSQ